MDETRFRDLISGQTRGVIPGCVRAGLWALSGGYAVGVALRNWTFDANLRKVHSAGIPVVSVGNLTTGGTGKTPFTAFVAQWFLERGRRVTILSRGYRSTDGQPNDEALVLQRLCPQVRQLQSPDRVAIAREAVEKLHSDVLILDDGFQHRRLKRDLNIVLVDALNPWGYDHLLPRGLLREPLAGLQRADLAVLTRADQCTTDQREGILKQIQAIKPELEVVEVAFPPRQLRNAAGEIQEFAALHGKPVVAFCGIGNPAGFRKTLSQCGLNVVDEQFRALPDHHHYNATDISDLAGWSQRIGAAALVTTLKDLVKFSESELGGCPLWAVETGVEILAGDQPLTHCLNLLLEEDRLKSGLQP